MIKYVIISLPRRISLIEDKREIRMAFSIWNTRERRICMYGGMYIKVFVSYDENADVWVAECDEIGLALESGSYDALLERIKTVALGLIELNGFTNKDIWICTKDRQIVCA